MLSTFLTVFDDGVGTAEGFKFISCCRYANCSGRPPRMCLISVLKKPYMTRPLHCAGWISCSDFKPSKLRCPHVLKYLSAHCIFATKSFATKPPPQSHCRTTKREKQHKISGKLEPHQIHVLLVCAKMHIYAFAQRIISCQDILIRHLAYLQDTDFSYPQRLFVCDVYTETCCEPYKMQSQAPQLKEVAVRGYIHG